MFVEKTSTEIVTIDNEIKVIGLSLQKSELPISFESLGRLWEIFGENHRGKVKNAVKPIIEYSVALNNIPDYIAGCAVTEFGDLEEGWLPYVILPGKYIKDTFNAETFEQLVGEKMGKRNVKAWAKKNKTKINGEFTIEAYPMDAIEGKNVEMYTLTPIKD